MISSILVAIVMANGILVEAFLPSARGAAAQGKGGGYVTEWLRNKLKALELLPGKVAEALPVIIGKIISWTLNRAKDVVGWVS